MAFGRSKEPKMVDSRRVEHRTTKLWLWLLWLIIMVISIAYCVLSFISFRKITKVANTDKNGIQKNVLWAVLAASFVGPFTVVAFFAFGTLILLKKTISESGLTFSYGALQFSALWMAVVVLQSGVALQGQKRMMSDFWEKKRGLDNQPLARDLPWGGGDTALVIATYVFAYLLAIFYLALFLAMFIFRKSVTKLELGPEPSASHFSSPRHSNINGAPSIAATQPLPAKGEGEASSAYDSVSVRADRMHDTAYTGNEKAKALPASDAKALPTPGAKAAPQTAAKPQASTGQHTSLPHRRQPQPSAPPPESAWDTGRKPAAAAEV